MDKEAKDSIISSKAYILKSLSTKFILAIIFSLLVSMPISQFLNVYIDKLIYFDGKIGVYINTLVNLVVVVAILMFLVNKIVIKPIIYLINETTKVAEGDLTSEHSQIQSEDEIGRLAEAFNKMRTNLRGMANQLQEKSLAISTAAENFSTNAKNISFGASETAATTNQVATTVGKVTINVQQIVDASTQASLFAKEGSKGLKSVVSQMEMIREATTHSGEVIYGLNESSAKISQIVALITQVADQTNLLALNAAIEAARAGDYGRGFAVVAEEVRKLAEQSASAAKEINTLIINIQQESQKAVKSMDQSVAQVETGTKVVTDIGETFNKIITAVQGLVSDIHSVAVATEQISSSIQNVAAANEEQTATMEEVAATTKNLTSMAEELDKTAKRFRLK